MTTPPEQTQIKDILALKKEIKSLLKNSYYNEAI